jgi:acetyl esterase/lipase
MRVLREAVRLGRGLQDLGQDADAEPPLPRGVARREENAALPDGQPLAMDVYRPARRGPSPAMQIVAGFDPRGIRAPQVVKIASLLAQAGAIAVVPDLCEVFRYQFTTRTAERIEASFAHMAGLPDARPDRLGVFGISVAGGFALAAATRPSMAERLRLFVGFAPFFDCESLLDFALTGRYSLDGEIRHARPHPWTRYIFFYNFLDLALDPADPGFETLREVMRLRLGKNGDAPDRLADTLAGGAKEALARIDGGDRSFDESMAALVLERHSALASALSPRSGFGRLRGRLFLIHSRDDDIIPFSESVRMAERCRALPDLRCDLLLTGHAGHGGPGRGPDVRQAARYTLFLHRVLRRLLL